jgi:putative membrane protein
VDPALILVISIAAFSGCFLGLLTGLIPGIHVNTLATILLTAFPLISSSLSGLVPEEDVAICVCSLIMSASVVHSFIDFIPSVFLGAPEDAHAVSILPGHRLLLDGRGMDAVRSAAIGSLIGCSAAILMAIPLQMMLSGGMEEQLDRITKGVLIVISTILILNERPFPGIAYGAMAFILSGALGYCVMELPIPCSGLLGEGTLLMPMLTGLFGLPTLMSSGGSGKIPAQKDPVPDPVGFIPGLKGVLMGTVAGWFPGITSTVGATVSSVVMPDRSPERFISTVASIGTVTTVLSLVTLSISGGGRSGTVIVIGDILGDSVSGVASENFLMLLISAAIASMVGYWLTIVSGKAATGFISGIDQNRMNKAVIAFLIIIVLLTTGPWGIVILIASVITGFVPLAFGLGRTVLCGCLILPVLLF